MILRSYSQCISAGHVFRLADRSVLAYGTLYRDGGVAEGDFVVDSLLMTSSLGRSNVFHHRLHLVGFTFGVCWRGSNTRRGSDVVLWTDEV